MRLFTSSPWGKPDDTTVVAEGVAFVTTPSHGGYKLNRAQNALVPEDIKALGGFYITGGWYEEDCEWAKVALTFPQFFPARALYHAVVMFTAGSPTYRLSPERLAKWLREGK